jgi:hypothetical protein
MRGPSVICNLPGVNLISCEIVVVGTFASVAAAVVDIFEFTRAGNFVAYASVRAIGTAAVMVVHIAENPFSFHMKDLT